MLPYDCWAAVAGMDLVLEEFSGDASCMISIVSKFYCSAVHVVLFVQGGSNMTGTDLCVNKPHCAAAVRP